MRKRTKILGLLCGLFLVISIALPFVPVPAQASVVPPAVDRQQVFYSELSEYTTSSDGNLYQTSTVYNTAWAAAAASAAVTANTVVEIGQSKLGSDYGISRGGLYFDTSSIADTDVVTSAVLYVYGKYDWSDTDFDLTIQSGMPTYPHDPMVVNDYSKAYYAGDGGSLNTSGFTTTGYNAITLNATGRGWINLTGTTKLVLRSSREIAGTAPTGEEEVFIYSSEEAGTDKDPYLVVTSVSAPAITSNAASNIANTTARLNSTVDDDGGESCETRYGYGTTSQAAVDFADYDTVTDWVAGADTGEHPYVDVDTLLAGTTYYYRVQIKNTHSTVTSDEITFDTLAAISEPSNFRAFPEAESVVLTWAKGSGSTNTMVRYSFTAYPTAVGEGTQLYLGTGSTTTHTGLSQGTTIYYSAWGEDGGDYSAAYVSTMTTTTGGAGAAENPDTPTAPTGWLQAPDYTNLSGLPIVYDIANQVFTNIEMPLATGWFLLAILSSIIASIAIYLWKHSLAGALVVLCVMLCAWWGVEILPLWIMALSLIGIIGIGISRRSIGGQ